MHSAFLMVKSRLDRIHLGKKEQRQALFTSESRTAKESKPCDHEEIRHGLQLRGGLGL